MKSFPVKVAPLIPGGSTGRLPEKPFASKDLGAAPAVWQRNARCVIARLIGCLSVLATTLIGCLSVLAVNKQACSSKKTSGSQCREVDEAVQPFHASAQLVERQVQDNE